MSCDSAALLHKGFFFLQVAGIKLNEQEGYDRRVLGLVNMLHTQGTRQDSWIS